MTDWHLKLGSGKMRKGSELAFLRLALLDEILRSQFVTSSWKGRRVENDETRAMEPYRAVQGASIKSLIHIVRGEQVILDSDLAALYEVETGNLNKAAARNSARFPEDFRFRLSKEEYDSLIFQIGSSNGGGGRGGRRKLPYAYTEQGVAMLSGLLRSDVAVNASVAIMRAFVEMRRFLANNGQLFEQLREIDVRQRLAQERNERQFEEHGALIHELFGLLEPREEPAQHIFFEGQVYDAFELLAEIVGKAEKSIVLVDGYVDLGTLNILKKKREGVAATVWTKARGDKLSDADVETFRAQYGPLELRHTEAFHDRFLVLDGTACYHVGASLKDAGKKCFALTLFEGEGFAKGLLAQLGAWGRKGDSHRFSRLTLRPVGALRRCPSLWPCPPPTMTRRRACPL